MKYVGFLLLLSCYVSTANADLISSLDFEDGQGVGYSVSTPEFSDGGSDFFTWTNGENIGSYSLGNIQGIAYFAAQDTNGDGGPTDLSLSWTVDISNYENLTLDFALAEDDDGSNQDWDADSSFQVLASIDGGSEVELFRVEAAGGTNTEPRVDTNFDGIGDGTAITDTFADFSASLFSTGNNVTFRFRFLNLEAGDEDIALDNIRLNGTFSAVPEPTSLAYGMIALTTLTLRRRRRK